MSYLFSLALFSLAGLGKLLLHFLCFWLEHVLLSAYKFFLVCSSHHFDPNNCNFTLSKKDGTTCAYVTVKLSLNNTNNDVVSIASFVLILRIYLHH